MPPGHAARTHLVRQGVIGRAANVQISSAYTYHAIAPDPEPSATAGL
jgi:hypothetical protein